ncbi:polysaccharide biosynthesis tyrosine autokinase [Notoacmeibacter ruber]|uniref:Polysaccharide biosynthesis tyrosine autokinase n=1 Tax=Notoacmeibacter ruber TaxID=2670375 RepID=A0A3L7JB15_9HYPH|nr:polysaccharide biosynthesis tyrosine autokinase [Notoacmeibacter ruber]RLQ87565.1 polysaccharide biosynthesis tyrosine autokinase [Notoacmeibacter ruber]
MLQRHIASADHSGANLPAEVAYGAPAGTLDMEEEKRIDLLALLGYVIRWRWLIAIFLLAGLLLGLAYSVIAPKMYQATARLELTMPMIVEGGVVSSSRDRLTLMNALEHVKSSRVGQRLVTQLNLAQNDEFLRLEGNPSLSKILRRAFGIGGRDLSSMSEERLERLALGKYKSIVNPVAKRDTSIIDIHVRFPDPEMAALIANGAAQVYANQIREFAVVSSPQPLGAEILERAVAPGAAYAPQRTLSVLVTLVLAGLAAAATIFLMELMNNKFMTPEQVESELNVPILGVIPFFKPADRTSRDLDSPTSAISEAYRSLRTNLTFLSSNGAPRTVAITSTEAAEGSSSVARKLAQDFSALGLNILLIDCNLRYPKQHFLFGIENLTGLSDLLSNNDDDVSLSSLLNGKNDGRSAAKVFRETSTPGLKLMTAGAIPSNPVDLLASSRMSKLVAALSDHFDLIIFDCPPILGLADAPLISRLAEGTAMVVSQKQVARKSAVHAALRIRRVNGRIFGAVFNKYDAGRSEGYPSHHRILYDYGGCQGADSENI